MIVIKSLIPDKSCIKDSHFPRRILNIYKLTHFETLIMAPTSFKA